MSAKFGVRAHFSPDSGSEHISDQWREFNNALIPVQGADLCAGGPPPPLTELSGRIMHKKVL
jgi:hypothetical protein